MYKKPQISINFPNKHIHKLKDGSRHIPQTERRETANIQNIQYLLAYSNIKTQKCQNTKYKE